MKKIKIISTICLTLFIIYVIFGFWGVPYIVKNILPDKLKENGINFKINEIKLNPLSLELNADGVEFGTNEPIFVADKIYLNIAFLPILQKTIDITSLDIQKPQINVKLGKGSNIAQLASDKSKSDEKSEPSSVKIRLNGLNIKDASVEYNDDKNSIKLDNINYENNASTQELIFSSKGAQVNLKSINLGKSTVDSDGVKIGFSGFEIGEELELKSDDNKISLNIGKMAILGLSLKQNDTNAKTDIMAKVISYELDMKNSQSLLTINELALSELDAQSGVFSTNVKQISLSQIAANIKDSLSASVGKLELSAVAATANKSSLADISKIAINSINLNQNTLNAQSINVGKTELFGSGKNGFDVLNISQIVANPNTMQIGDVALDKMRFQSDLTDSGLSVLEPIFEALSNNKASKNPQSPSDKAPINLKIENIALNEASINLAHKFKGESITLKNDRINLKIKNFSLNDRFNLSLSAKDALTDLNVSGTAQISPLKAQLKLDAPSIIISPYYAYARPFLNAQLGGKGRLKLTSNITLNGEKYSLHSKANLNDISLTENSNKSLQVDEIALQSLVLTQNSLSLDGLKISSVKADIIRQKDGKLNLAALIKEQKNEKTPAKSKPETKDEELKLELKNISLNDAKVSFSDETVGFKTQINRLDASATALTKVAPISLSANANDAYLSINGKALLTDIEEDTELKINLKNLNLQRLSPYSAKFLGRDIDTGLATLFTQVKINKGALNVSNDLNLDNLVLGKSVPSPDAVSLPLDMALAILRDFKNQIDISLPISASVNDPSFHFAGVVVQAITQMLTDVVFSPFKFIGKALGMDASKLSSIDFAAGSAQMLQSESEKAAEFKKIAEEKGFKITITPEFNPNADAKAMVLSELGEKASKEEIENEIKKIDLKELQNLALERANAVKSMLLEAGISQDNIKIESKIDTNAPVKQDKFIPIKMGISK